MRAAISPGERLAVTLRYLATGEKMLTLTDRATYFGFRVIHSGTMLRYKTMARVLHEQTPTTFGQQCCSNLNRLQISAICFLNKMVR